MSKVENIFPFESKKRGEERKRDRIREKRVRERE